MALPVLAARAALPIARTAARRALAAGGRFAQFTSSQLWGGGQRQRQPSYGRRRRARGISAAELRGFRKVANLVKQFSAPGRRTIFRAPRRRRGFGR